jgi:2-polyprenyl-3-methyl-5-hydroxy-6-metoxy-1,4-benzoquinol methylase
LTLVEKNRNCPACGSPRFVEKGSKNGFSLLGCRDCATLYTSQLPGGEEEAQDYDEYYSAQNLSVPEFVHRRLDEIVAGFDSYRQNNRLLDVGCGAGTMLQAANRSGWSVEGLEVSPPAVAYLKELGFNVRRAFLEEAEYPDNHFDVVTACGVMEHVPDVAAFTAEIARILRPGGLFYATTPNGAGGSAKLLGVNWTTVAPPEHLHLFSVSGMKKFLAGHGFKSVKVSSEGANPYEIMHHFRHRGHQATNGAGGDEAAAEGQNFDRVNSAYALNESFSRNRYRRFAKDVVNRVLHLSRLGDELKAYAEKNGAARA